MSKKSGIVIGIAVRQGGFAGVNQQQSLLHQVYTGKWGLVGFIY